MWEPYKANYPKWRDMTDLELLGLPCSPEPAGLDRYVAKYVTRLQSRTRAIAKVAEKDPHVGFLLLRMCAGFAASVHLARAMGPIDAFKTVDAGTIEAMNAIAPLGERDAQFARLPFRLGGLGLRSIFDHSATAFAAATIETAPIMRLFSPVPLPEDPLLNHVLPLVPACAILAVQDQAALSSPDPKLQRSFLKLIDDHAAAVMKYTDDERIRTNSTGSRGASLYLVGPLTYDDQVHNMFLEPTQFVAAVKLRLGQEVIPQAGTCTLCFNHEVDTTGHAAQKCMRCGFRTRAHNALRDCLAGLLRDALMTPTVEPHPFAGAKNLRADIAYSFSGCCMIVDCAITHPFRDKYRADAADRKGGAATAYEHAHHLRGTQRLVPFVLDTFGAMGQSAELATKSIVPLYARRMGLSATVASRIVFGRLTTCVVRWMATIATLA